jgi:ferredoxin
MSKKLEDLYQQLVRAALSEKSDQEVAEIIAREKEFPELDCLLNPKRYPVMWLGGECLCEDKSRCTRNCLFEAIEPAEGGGIKIDPERCVGCGLCAEGCDAGVINSSRDLVAMLLAMKHWHGPIYALVAPAISGQMGESVSLGQLRSAFKRLGFDGMVEVALFADILTLKEALEFDKHVRTEADFHLTSCCCPIWIAMIRRHYELLSHVPPAVSPMIAAGRTIKQLYPGAMTVFVGPCVAKKSEAREKDLAGAVDFVLTFQELRDLFAFTATDPASLEVSEKEHASGSGIGYAYSGGVRGDRGDAAEGQPKARAADAPRAGRRRGGVQGDGWRDPGGEDQCQLLRGHGLRGRMRRRAEAGSAGRGGKGAGAGVRAGGEIRDSD